MRRGRHRPQAREHRGGSGPRGSPRWGQGRRPCKEQVLLAPRGGGRLGTCRLGRPRGPAPRPAGSLVPPQAHIYSLGATLKAALDYVTEPEPQPRLSRELEALLGQMQAEDPGDRPDLQVSAKAAPASHGRGPEPHAPPASAHAQPARTRGPPPARPPGSRLLYIFATNGVHYDCHGQDRIRWFHEADSAPRGSRSPGRPASRSRRLERRGGGGGRGAGLSAGSGHRPSSRCARRRCSSRPPAACARASRPPGGGCFPSSPSRRFKVSAQVGEPHTRPGMCAPSHMHTWVCTSINTLTYTHVRAGVLTVQATHADMHADADRSHVLPQHTWKHTRMCKLGHT